MGLVKSQKSQIEEGGGKIHWEMGKLRRLQSPGGGRVGKGGSQAGRQVQQSVCMDGGWSPKLKAGDRDRDPVVPVQEGNHPGEGAVSSCIWPSLCV